MDNMDNTERERRFVRIESAEKTKLGYRVKTQDDGKSLEFELPEPEYKLIQMVQDLMDSKKLTEGESLALLDSAFEVAAFHNHLGQLTLAEEFRKASTQKDGMRKTDSGIYVPEGL